MCGLDARERTQRAWLADTKQQSKVPPKRTRGELSGGTPRCVPLSGQRAPSAPTLPTRRCSGSAQKGAVPAQRGFPSPGESPSCCSLNSLGIHFSRHQTEQGNLHGQGSPCRERNPSVPPCRAGKRGSCISSSFWGCHQPIAAPTHLTLDRCSPQKASSSRPRRCQSSWGRCHSTTDRGAPTPPHGEPPNHPTEHPKTGRPPPFSAVPGAH